VEILKSIIKEKGRRFIPHVIEPSFGSDRLAYVALEYAYSTKKDRVVLNLPYDISPVQIAVLPLVKKDGLPEYSIKLKQNLVSEGFLVEYDETGSIGRRYSRFDEIGTPICITIDYKTLDDETVTLRNRDSWRQVRTNINDLPQLLNDFFNLKKEFQNLGILLNNKED
jgi:glycyl-tRNA synthetase